MAADMTDHDAARLAEIRAKFRAGDVVSRTEAEIVFAALDAAAWPHDASFVSRAMYDAAIKATSNYARHAELNGNRAEAAEASAANLAAALAASEAKLCVMMQALEPFVEEFERHMESYLRRGERTIMRGNFDRMPDHWPMDKFNITFGQCRAARATLPRARPPAQEE